ncbi:unnamed protein product, partial [Urochloa humidicola]
EAEAPKPFEATAFSRLFLGPTRPPPSSPSAGGRSERRGESRRDRACRRSGASELRYVLCLHQSCEALSHQKSPISNENHYAAAEMFDDQDLGFFTNFVGVFVFVLITAYHYVMADPKFEGN